MSGHTHIQSPQFKELPVVGDVVTCSFGGEAIGEIVETCYLGNFKQHWVSIRWDIVTGENTNQVAGTTEQRHLSWIESSPYWDVTRNGQSIKGG